MKRKILSVIVLLITISATLYLTGCSCIFGNLDSMVNSYTVTDSIPGWQLRKIEPGTKVIFNLKDGTKISGEYERLISISEKDYSETYYKNQKQMPEGIVLPALRDIMTYTLLSSEEKYDVRFLGFDYGYINISPIEIDKPEKLWLENIKDITDIYGNKIEGEILRNLMYEGKIPVSSAISVKEGKNSTFLAVNEIAQIQIKTKKEINTTGYIVGAIIDLTIGAFILNYFINELPEHW